MAGQICSLVNVLFPYLCQNFGHFKLYFIMIKIFFWLLCFKTKLITGVFEKFDLVCQISE